MFKSKCIIKAVLVVLVIGIIAGCAVFQDFLAPSDLLSSVEKRDGLRIVDINISDENVQNNDTNKFIVSCIIKLKWLNGSFVLNILKPKNNSISS